MQILGHFFGSEMSRCVLCYVRACWFVHVWFVSPGRMHHVRISKWNRFKTAAVIVHHHLCSCLLLRHIWDLYRKAESKTCLHCVDIKSPPVYITFEGQDCLIHSSLYCKACMPGKYEKCRFFCRFPSGFAGFLLQHDFVKAERYCLGKAIIQ